MLYEDLLLISGLIPFDIFVPILGQSFSEISKMKGPIPKLKEKLITDKLQSYGLFFNKSGFIDYNNSRI
jgi:hypothetical protein